MPPAERPLSGLAVLLTRPAGRSARLARQLRALGARVSERPTIAFEPPADRAPVREVISRLAAFDWLVFSSPTGVHFFVRELELRGLDRASIPGRIAAVGPGTAARLTSSGLRPDLVAERSHAEGLADALIERVRSGDRVVWIRPEVARPLLTDALQSVGVTLEGVVFYRTIAAPRVASIAEQVCRGRFDVIVFTSPSTLIRLVEGLPDDSERVLGALRRASIVAIGPVTATALERAGLRPSAVAAVPRDESVVAAVRSAVGV